MVKKQSVARCLHPKSLSLTGTGLYVSWRCLSTPAAAGLLKRRELAPRSGRFSGLLKVIFPLP